MWLEIYTAPKNTSIARGSATAYIRCFPDGSCCLLGTVQKSVRKRTNDIIFPQRLPYFYGKIPGRPTGTKAGRQFSSVPASILPITTSAELLLALGRGRLDNRTL